MAQAGLHYTFHTTALSESSGTVGEILQQNGYNTAWFGKNHTVPDWQSRREKFGSDMKCKFALASK